MDYTFKDVEFLTAEDKQAVLQDWKQFITSLLSGYGTVDADSVDGQMPMPLHEFTDKLYKHITLHCSFIAHYSLYGFYSVYFEEPEMIAKFFSQWDKDKDYISVELGGDYWFKDERYNDLNIAMAEELEQYLPRLYKLSQDKQKEVDVIRAKVLLEKHGLTI